MDPITPQLRAIDSIKPQDETFGNALRGGVTSACTGPESANVIGETYAAMVRERIAVNLCTCSQV